MAASKSIKSKAEQLSKALDKVARLANEIAAYADKHGVDQDQFFYENRLDMAYEFDLSELLENLDAVADGEYENWG